MAVQPTNLPSTGGTDDPQDVQGTTKKEPGSAFRPVESSTNKENKRPFKEVLERKLEKEAKQSVVVKTQSNDDEEEEKLSPLELAAQTKIREQKPQPTITSTAVFRKDDQLTESQPVVQNTNLVVDDDTLTAGVVETDVPVSVPVKTADVKIDAPVSVSVKTAEKTPDNYVSTKPIVKEKVEEKVVAGNVQTPKVVELEKYKDKGKEVAATVAANVQKIKEAQKDETVAAGKKSDEPENVINIALTSQNVVQEAAPVQQQPIANNGAKVRETLIKLAQQMVERIQQVTEPGRTDTTLTLKYPPLFEGVSVKITEFDTSRKQFNVTFGDINNPEARALIELPANQARLQQAILDLDKGYTLQLITIEQKIPGLSSTQTSDIASNQERGMGDQQAGTATDQEDNPLA